MHKDAPTEHRADIAIATGLDPSSCIVSQATLLPLPRSLSFRCLIPLVLFCSLPPSPPLSGQGHTYQGLIALSQFLSF